MQKVTGHSILLWLLVSGSATQASQQQGIDWLKQSVNGDSLNNPSIASNAQAKSELAYTLSLLDSYPASIDVSVGDDQSTEALSRALLLAAKSGADSQALLQAILVRQNSDGGFGHLEGWQSTVLDTSLVLLLADNLPTEATKKAIQFLISQQAVDGAYYAAGYQEIELLYINAYVLLAANKLITTYPELTDGLKKHITYLEGKKTANGQWSADNQDLFIEALLNQALHSYRQNMDNATAFSQKAFDLQLGDGSWEDDAYVTSVVLRSLNKQLESIKNPLLSGLKLAVVDVETNLPLANVKLSAISSDTPEKLIFTNASGYIDWQDLESGNYQFQLSLSGYLDVKFQLTLEKGKYLDSGTLKLSRESISSATYAYGKIVDAVTLLPLPNVLVLSGNDEAGVLTNAKGEFQLSLPPDANVILKVSKEGYTTQQVQFDVVSGGKYVFSPNLSPVQPAISVSGQVKNQLGQSLAGVSIVYNGQDVGISDSQGAFFINNTPKGLYVLTLKKTGYHDFSLNVDTTNNQSLVIPPVVLEQSSNNTGSALAQGVVVFDVRDIFNNRPVGGVRITAEKYNLRGELVARQYYTTDGERENLSITFETGRWRFLFEHQNYDTNYIYHPVQQVLDVVENQTIEVSKKLSFSNQAISAKLQDPITGKPINGAKVRIYNALNEPVSSMESYQGGSVFLSTNQSQFRLVIDHPSYIGSTFYIDLEKYKNLDLGVIYLRNKFNSDSFFPDLAIADINSSSLVYEQQELSVEGQLGVEIKNEGNLAIKAGQSFDVVAFIDSNKNKLFDTTDTVIGLVELNQEINTGQKVNMTIPVKGVSSFTNAPFMILLDAQNSIPEKNEKNNTASTIEFREIKPPISELEPVEKWYWNLNQGEGIEHPPLVMPMFDSNNDGIVNSLDMPNVIVSSYGTNIYILSGQTGELVTNIHVPNGTWSTPALGDINKDGVPEILTVDSYGAVLAFSPIGTLLWKTNNTNFTIDSNTNVQLADLDGDGNTEVIYGGHVFDNKGQLKFKLAEVIYHFPVIADIDLDGVPEILSDGIIFDNFGNIKKKTDAYGSAAVARFTDSIYPQIVWVGNGIIRMTDYQGNTLWSGNTTVGGVPTIADMDQDGYPDIGTIYDYRYMAFKGDGTLMWTSPISDVGGGTGSTVFDFNNDGKVEVLYADEHFFYIYDGATGNVLNQLPHSSGTRSEYPVVADVDNDGHADILLAENMRIGRSSTIFRGVKAYSGKNNDWANTRNIWNQHTYHVTNINDDLTVPQHEPNSWEVHNTYRANLLLNESSTAAADPSASYIRITDNGVAAPSVFTVRIGNAGGKTINTGLPISFYQGNPAQGGVLLGTTLTSRALASGEYEDVAFNYTGSLANFGELYIVANDKGTSSATVIQEYTAANNIAHLPVQGGYQKLNLQSSLDKSSYQSTESLSINSVINNLGSFDSLADLRLSLIDSAGQTLGSLPFVPLSLAVQTTINNASLWSASGLRKGDYTIKAELYRDNQRVAQQLLPFSVLSDAAPTGLLAPSLTSNKKSYSSADTVTLTQQLRNSSTNEVANNVQTTLVLQKADGTVIWQQSRDYGQIAPQVLREQSFQVPLLNAAAGDYSAHLTVTADNMATVSSEAHFNVLPTAMTGVGLTGQLQGATEAVWYQDLNYTWQVNNQGNSDVLGLPVRLAVINPQTEQLITTLSASADVAQNGQAQQQSQLSIFGMTAPLLVLLQVQIGDDWKTLAQQPLTVTKPVVTTQITADKTQYGLNDPIVINEVINNQSVVNLQQVKVTTLISQPNGQVVSESNQVVDINAQSQVPQTVNYTLNRAVAGQWQIITIIQDKNGNELSRQVSGFEVLSSTLTGEGLTGRLTLPTQAVKGQAITLDWGLTNAGNNAYTDLPTRIELLDDQQQVIATLTNPVANLAVDTPFNQQQAWTVVGNYNQVLQARLSANVANQWKVLANATIQVLAPQISDTLSTNKTSYGFNDKLDINQHIQNDSPVLLNNLKVTTLISRPDGIVVDTQQSTLNLAAQSGVEQPVSYQLTQADAGQWTITSLVQDEQGIELTRQVKTIEVTSSAMTGEGINGTLTAAPVEVTVGQDVTLALALNNQGNTPLTAQAITLTISKVGNNTPVKVMTVTVDSLAKGSTLTKNANWTVAGQAGDVFSVVATTSFNGQVKTLASASFMAKAPQVVIELTPELAAQSRVLVYYSCGHGWYKGIKGWSFGDCHYSCFDQRSATLRAYLDSLKVNYSLVTKESDFVKAFRSGRYNQTWLLGAIEKLPKDFDDELHEAINRGDALVTDGGVQTWYNHEIYDIVGVKYRGRLNFTNSEITLNAPVFSQPQSIGKVKSAGWPLYLKPTTGTVTATYGANYCKSVDKDWIRDKEDEDKEFYGRHHQQLNYPAMVSNQYGYGKGLSMAFDLIASLDQPKDKTKWLSLLDQSLLWTNPTVNHRVDYVAQELVAVRSQLKNAGATAQTIRLQVTLPSGAVWMGTGTVDANRTVTQHITLAANSQQQVWLPILLPSLAGTHQLAIKVLSADGQQIISEKQQSFTVKGIDNRFAEVRIGFEQLALNKWDDKLRDRAVGEIRDAQYLWNKGRYQEALAGLGDASAYVRNIEGRDVSKERLALDILMKGLSIQWFNSQR